MKEVHLNEKISDLLRQKEFNYEKEVKKLITRENMNKIAKIHELKGRQDVYLERSQDKLSYLKHRAALHSAIANSKLDRRPVHRNKFAHLNLDIPTYIDTPYEYEYVACKDCYVDREDDSREWLSPAAIKLLHEQLHFCMYDMPSRFRNLYSIAEYPDPHKMASDSNTYKFKQFPAYVERNLRLIAEQYKKAKEEYDPLLLIPIYIIDFLCIEPFLRGNHKLSRLLMHDMLYCAGHEVVKYVSLDRLLKQREQEYRNSLINSSFKWLKSENSYHYFVEFILEIIEEAYLKLDEIHRLLPATELSKTDRVEFMIRRLERGITKSTLCELMPEVSSRTVERVLQKMCERNELDRFGSGPSTSYSVSDPDECYSNPRFDSISALLKHLAEVEAEEESEDLLEY